MAEEPLYDSQAIRRFTGIELGDDRIPDETTILGFRHLLERHGLTEAIFAEVIAHLADKGITLRLGTLVDVSGHRPSVRVRPRKIIDALSSTKTKARARCCMVSKPRSRPSGDWSAIELHCLPAPGFALRARVIN